MFRVTNALRGGAGFGNETADYGTKMALAGMGTTYICGAVGEERTGGVDPTADGYAPVVRTTRKRALPVIM